MEPLRFSGDGAVAMQKLATVMRELPGARVTAQDGDYLRAEVTTRWLGFRDDVEFVLDRSAGVIHFRSASRLGSDDLGVNRARMETVRARFSSPTVHTPVASAASVRNGPRSRCRGRDTCGADMGGGACAVRAR